MLHTRARHVGVKVLSTLWNCSDLDLDIDFYSLKSHLLCFSVG